MTFLLPVINPDEVIESIGLAVKNKLDEHRAKGVVIGLSGGVDSSLTLAVCAVAAKKYGFFVRAYTLPGSLNSSRTVKYAHECALKFGVPIEIIPIQECLDCLGNLCLHKGAGQKPESLNYHRGNMASRLRALILHTKAAVHNSLVMGTGNYDEDFGIGYYTLFGDGAVHFSPIGGLAKRLVRQIARYLGMDDIANQEPSAELEPGQTDFNDLGYSYDAVEIVVALYKSGLSVNEICNNKRLSHILGPYNLKRGKKFSSLKEAVKNIVHRHVNSALPKMRLINPGQARINLRYLDTGLIIGRFQPFHNGHIDMIRSVYCLGVKKIVILIGADVLMNKSKNPFAPEMMKKCMEEYFLDSPDAPFYEDAKFVFLVINDINRPDEYAEYISSKTGLNAQNAFIASNNSYTLGCFKDWACFTMGSEKAFNVSATRIRRALLNNDPSWKNDVPDQTVKFIEKNL